MKLGRAIKTCKVRGYVSNKSTPEIKYWKNHKKTIVERVIEKQKEHMLDMNWDSYDPESLKTSITA